MLSQCLFLVFSRIYDGLSLRGICFEHSTTKIKNILFGSKKCYISLFSFSLSVALWKALARDLRTSSLDIFSYEITDFSCNDTGAEMSYEFLADAFVGAVS